MTHPDGDTLLKFVLQTLDESENEAVRQHLRACDRCTEEERKLEGELRRLSALELPVEKFTPPRLPRRSIAPLLKVAAVLAVGFLLGYATAQLSNTVHPVPVQQRLIPSQIAVPSSGYVPAQEVDVRTPRPL
jgi:anti-sigma factor ChrR (cupin superfamily)